jgi:uncharacterized membrane protein
MSNKTVKIVRIVGWVTLIALLALLAVYIAAVWDNLSQNPPKTSQYNVRYLDLPVVMLLHVVPGLLFLMFGILQFMPWIRRKYIKLHRFNGWVLAVAAIVSGLFGVIAIFQLPPIIVGLNRPGFYLAGVLLIVFVAMGIYRIKTKNIIEHRKWMIRAFVVGFAIVNTRVYAIILVITMEYYRSHDPFGIAFNFAWVTNLILAELWIRRTANREGLPTAKAGYSRNIPITGK